jgi:hypothetical protein
MSHALKRIRKLSLSLRTLSAEAADYSTCRQVTRLPMNTKRSPLVTGTFNEYGD